MDTMKFTLGCETVTAINDGGLNIWYNLGKGDIDFRLGGVRPVLSLEAKRRKSKRRDDPELPWEYASQIFAEMLGQVCYIDFFKNPHMEYQEVTTSLQQLQHIGFRNPWKSFVNYNLLLQVPQSISFRNLRIWTELFEETYIYRESQTPPNKEILFPWYERSRGIIHTPGKTFMVSRVWAIQSRISTQLQRQSSA